MSAWKNRPWAARFGCALHGLARALRSERSLRTQALVLVLVLIGLCVLRVTPVWWALVCAAAGTVLAAELLNTAIEQLADALHPEKSTAIGAVKDSAAAAVLIAALAAAAVGVALLVHLLRRP